MDERDDRSSADPSEKANDGDGEPVRSAPAPSAPASKNAWPMILVLGSVLMAIVRFGLMTTSRKYPWIAYKTVMILLALIGFVWLKRNRPRDTRILGYFFLTFGFIFFTLFFNGGSDRAAVFGGGALLLGIISIAAGIAFSFTKKINMLGIVGALMITAGIVHFLGLLANAAGVDMPPSYMPRMHILYWGGWALYFLGKKATAKGFITNMLIVIGATFFLFFLIIAIIH